MSVVPDNSLRLGQFLTIGSNNEKVSLTGTFQMSGGTAVSTVSAPVTILVERVGSLVSAFIPSWSVDVTVAGTGIINFSTLIPASLRPLSLCLYPVMNSGIDVNASLMACNGATGSISMQPSFTGGFAWIVSPTIGPYGPIVLSWKAQ
jgi:hypothetical protein